MEGPRELYHEEIKKLKDFRSRLDTHAIYKQDLESFSDDYEELVAQAKVITRVSDRLQKKLDNANLQIREQNDEIKLKNTELEKTIQQLVQARVGRKASTIMFTLAIVLFISEEFFLEEMIESYVSIPYLGLIIKGLIALGLKFFESALETFFLNQEKKKIIAQERKEEELQAALAN
ncbi:hypothetical protein [Marinoscillum furvescens]|uniref:Uncharacterized protein n=1 Tax=Marinoscillum furvescens DSM 4134 TaxID=1122208 RepID=A0A3D9L748_MARFU|nr:hypothetical protein [Marinoscillum furvescens]REE02181.1 hypothetical protein C7460_102205 [Marinoscillum furvescens DSM 4134]